MANEAHKEPTMEEILASIRKIISDDDTAPQAAEPAPVEDTPAPVEVQASFDEDDLHDIDDVMFEEAPETEEVSTEEVVADEEAFEVEFEQFEADPDEVSEPPSFEEMLGAARAVVAAPKAQEAEEIVEEVFPEAIVEEVAPEPEPEPEPAAPEPVAASVEEDMAATARYQQTVLTDDQTADVAAGALGKLISKMDMGGDNTIEALVRELLKPMMKEWLDANLAKIVEEKVEAEVQRIARMAR
eukprot:TRINITY_DN11812_c0_g1_i1.p1 TRINITY_DN11812_c0_g1~~TRINITY_DN11812_c0_g1_i1.p1  ORF type:complete len:243 (+),score=68.69 TRINITY_DN11812_c0_g1_i1:760-1488(+)